MNTNQLRYFVTAAECRSFTKAADQFYITQTAITQQIHALEDSLGVPLFDRSSRPISLTPAGSAFLSDARSILGRIDQAVNRIQEVSTGMVGTLRIGYTKGFERSNFSNSLRFFHNKYPNILVSCYRRNTLTGNSQGYRTIRVHAIYCPAFPGPDTRRPRSFVPHVPPQAPS